MVEGQCGEVSAARCGERGGAVGGESIEGAKMGVHPRRPGLA